ncbi:MAG: Flagellar biosynthesis protein FliO [Pseudomonadota bacterium]
MTNGLANSLDWVSMISSFLLVIGLLAVVLYLLKRFQPGGLATGRQIQLLESLGTGARQQVVLVRVRDKDLLLGVSVNQINTLAEWPASESSGQGASIASLRTVGASPAIMPAAQALSRFFKKK